MKKLFIFKLIFVLCLATIWSSNSFSADACPALFFKSPFQTKSTFDSKGRIKIHLAPGALERLSGGILKNLIEKLSVKGALSGEFSPQTLNKEVVMGDSRLLKLLDAEFMRPLAKIFHSTELKDLLGQFDPRIKLGKSEFRIAISDLSLSPADDLVERLGLLKDFNHGSIVNVEIQLESLDAHASESHFDIVRDKVGRIGFKDLRVQSRGAISLSIPVFLGVHKSGLPDFQILAVDGLDPEQLSVQVKNLLLPKIQIKIDGETIEVSPPPQALENLQTSIIDAVTNPAVVAQVNAQIVDFLNHIVAKLIQSKFTAERGIRLALEIDPEMFPAKNSSRKKSEPIVMSVNLLPLSISSDHASLAVGIDMQTDAKTDKKVVAVQELGECPFACTQYDVAVALNRDLLQDIFNQAYKKNLIKNIATPQGGILVLESPQIEYASSKANDKKSAFIKLKLKLKPENMPSLSGALLKGDFSLSVNVLVQISPEKSGKAVKFEVIEVSADKLAIDETSLRTGARLFAAFVPKTLKMGMQDVALGILNQSLMSGDKSAMRFAIPSEIAELMGPLKVVGLNFDENQNLYLLLKQ